MTRLHRSAAVIIALAAAGCERGSNGPATLDNTHDACNSCRMIVSDRRLASQIVEPGEDARFFDDLACLRDYVKAHALSGDAVVFVADHRTGEWVVARAAVVSRLPRPTTPMASGLVAHASAASREADRSAAGSEPVRLEIP